MAPQALPEAEVSWFGVAGDRRWAFIRPGAVQSGSPWWTLREYADPRHYHPRFAEPERPDRSATFVRTPSGIEFEVADPALAGQLGAEGLQPIRQDRGVFDTFPLSLITTQTIASLSKTVGMELDTARFRPNFLVEAEGNDPFPEDGWLGAVLRIGGVRMRVDKRDGRCAVITIDPQSGTRSPAVLRAVAQERQGCLGIYATTVQPGRCAVGDLVPVESVG